MSIKDLALVVWVVALPVSLAAQVPDGAAPHAIASAGRSDLASVLTSLSERHGFSLSGLNYLQSAPAPVALSGNLTADLQRLLRNANFILTYATENGKVKVEQVTIINAQIGSKKPAEQVRLPDKDTLQSFVVTP